MKIIKSKYDIKKLDNQISSNDSPSESPEDTSVILISASKGTGKTTLLVNLITRKKYYRKKFNNVYLASQTCKSDSKYDNINLDDLNGLMCGTFDEGIIEQWYEEIKTELEEVKQHNKNLVLSKSKKKPKSIPLTLMIIDDYASYLKNSKALMNLVLNSRHLKLTLIITSQKYALFPSYLRENADVYIIYEASSGRERQFITEDLLEGILTKNQINDLFNEVYVHKRDFLLVNTRKDKKDRFYKNFDKIIL